MSEPIGKGDWVECVRDSIDYPGTFTVGGLYQVKSTTAIDRNGIAGVQIVGKPSRHEACGWGWNVLLFRPVYRPRADLIERLLQPVDAVSEQETVR